MALPAGVDGVTVSSGKPLTLPDGTPFEGKLLFTGPDVVTVAGQDVLLGGTREAKLVGGEFSITLAANDVAGMSPSGWTYTVTAVLSNAPSWVRHVSLPKASPSVVLADVIVPDSVAGSYAALVDPSSLGANFLPKAGGTLTGDLTVEGYTTLQGGQANSGWSVFGAVAALAPDASVAHQLDGSTGVASLGTKNGLTSTRFCGHLTSSGAPTTGAWTAGDTIQDADGAFWLCTAGGSPGTWTGGLVTQPWVFDVTAAPYGAKGDGQVVADGAMSSGSAVLTSATANWPTSVVGKAISVKGAGANGVTTLITTVASRQSSTQITLSAANASGGALSGAVVIWGTDDTAAIQAAVNAAETYLASHTYAKVFFPPRPYIVAGPLNTSKSGNGQIVFGAYPVSDVKRILEFRGAGDGTAAVRHWQQTKPQFAGSCLISLGVYASTSAQIADINAHGNPGVICGPNEGSGYGTAANFSNVMPVIEDLAILTSHSTFGLTYGAGNLWGCATAHVDDFGYGTAGTVASPSTDYSSPGVLGTGLSIGLLLPAPGNNDHVVTPNISCGGGYTYAMFMTEHTVMARYMALYCWAGLVAVGTYAGSVGSVHAMKVLSASIEACTNELYIYGAGSSGVGPIVDIDQLSTENSTPNVAGSSTGAMNAALGKVRLTGLFTESGVSVSAPTGIELFNGQVPRAIKRKTAGFTCSPIDRTLVCDTSGGAFTGTLPAADFCPTEYVFKNVGSNNLTVGTTSSQLIYTTSGTGATTATVTTGQTLRVQALFNGTSWGWYAV